MLFRIVPEGLDCPCEAFESDPTAVVEFVRWLGLRRGLSGSLDVLDVGAGTGRLLPHLSALGWRVTATEPDRSSRERLADVASAAGGSVTAEAFNGLAYEQAFDLVIAVNSAFAHVLTPAARHDALRRLLRALRPNGVVFLDLPNFSWILGHYQSPEEQVRLSQGREIRLHRQHEIDNDRATFTTVETYTIIEPDGARRTEWRRHVYAMTTLPDLLRLMEDAGFADVETYTSYHSRQVERQEGPRMLLTARRAPGLGDAP